MYVGNTPTRPQETSPRKPFIWIGLHSLIIIVIFIQILTGLRFAIFRYPELLTLSAILPQGNLHFIHSLSGLVLTLVVLSYLVYRLRVQRNILQAGFHLWVIRFGYLIIIGMIVSGWLLFYDQTEFISVGWLHYWMAMGVALYLLLHGGVYFVQYGVAALKRMILVDVQQLKQQWVLALPFLVLILLIWKLALNDAGSRLLVNKININQVITIDGEANETLWRDADSVYIQTQGGANFENGKSLVEMKGLHNGEEAYFLIRWQDPTQSVEHLPLKKTSQGWQVQGRGFSQFDETAFYEDKFAILLSEQCELAAAGTVHLGPKPLKEKPSNWHGRGYHYATDNHVRDLWHWKAVRTNEMHLADDNFIGKPDLARPEQKRYTAGYAQDSKESGAYVMNWDWYQTSQVTPKRLPKNLLAKQNTKIWMASWFDYEPYQLERDRFPEGTQLPSVLYRSNRFEGDRADVRAHGRWDNGYWTLELVRKLNTNSQFDVPLKSNVCLWVSAFDHAQTHHTRHQQAIKLQFEDEA